MRTSLSFSVLLSLALTITIACGREPADSREYTLKGQVLSVAEDRKEANIKHEEISGFMPAMTMPYKVRDAKEMATVVPGDLISATLIVESNDAYITDVKKVGQAPIEATPEPIQLASSGVELLQPGQPAPATTLVDQEGKKRKIAEFSGQAVVLTFIYTSCPLPTFCPLMDRNFMALQERIKADPALRVRLLTVSFDPDTDTPPVLKRHGQKLGFDPRVWTFATGDPDEIREFSGRFGVSVGRPASDQRDIIHNLRTAILDRSGNLVKVYTGNEWTAADVIADIKMLVGVD